MFKIPAALSGWIVLSVVTGGLVLNYQPIMLAKTDTQPTIVPKISATEEIRLEVSLTHRQVTLYKGTIEVARYPIAIGRPKWETPTGTFHITQMLPNPVWINPLTGDIYPPSDPANPLGPYWIGFWTQGWIWYGFHGTNDPESVGQAISHGCLRMYNHDIKELFSQVSLGTSVKILP